MLLFPGPTGGLSLFLRLELSLQPASFLMTTPDAACCVARAPAMLSQPTAQAVAGSAGRNEIPDQVLGGQVDHTYLS